MSALAQRAVKQSKLGKLVTGISQQMSSGNLRLDSKVAGSVMALEGLDHVVSANLCSTLDTFSAALESLVTAADMSGLSIAQVQAAEQGFIISSNIRSFMSQPVGRSVPATENMMVVAGRGQGTMSERGHSKTVSLESYDESENRAVAAYNVGYNMQASRQDPFCEAIFPTVTLPVDQLGAKIDMRLVQVYNELVRKVSGDAVGNMGRRNIIHAQIDPDILRDNSTTCYPIVRADSEDKFVDTTLLPPRTIKQQEHDIVTSALAVGKRLSLLDLSQTDLLLSKGVMDSTDALEPAVALTTLYWKIGDEVFSFKHLNNSAAANFAPAPQGFDRQMNLNYLTSNMTVGINVRKVDGSASTVLAPIVTGKYSVRLSTGAFGSVNLQTGDIEITAGALRVVEILDQDAVSVSLTVGAGKAIVDLFETASVIGYDVSARRSNSNHRQRGKLLDSVTFSLFYPVQLRSPISIPRPTGDQIQDSSDASDLASLVLMTHVLTSNAGVDALIAARDTLASNIDFNGGTLPYDPEIYGIARLMLTPYFKRESLKVPDRIANLKAHEWSADLQATLVNKLRDMVYDMYIKSGYKAFADAMAGGAAETPEVVIATDQYISRYIMVDSDFRTLCNDFKLRVVSTQNKLMHGQIAIVFSAGATAEGMFAPTGFGNMLWKPETTYITQISRNGQTSRELTVAPSFEHIVHQPVMAWLDVSGISEAVANRTNIHVKVQ